MRGIGSVQSSRRLYLEFVWVIPICRSFFINAIRYTLPDVINDLFNRNYALLLNCYFDKPIKPDIFFIAETEDKKYQMSKEIALKNVISNSIVIEYLSKYPLHAVFHLLSFNNR